MILYIGTNNWIRWARCEKLRERTLPITLKFR